MAWTDEEAKEYKKVFGTYPLGYKPTKEKESKPESPTQKEKAQARYEGMLARPNDPYWRSPQSTVDSTMLGLERVKTPPDTLAALSKEIAQQSVINEQLAEQGADTTGGGAYVAAKARERSRIMQQRAGIAQPEAAWPGMGPDYSDVGIMNRIAMMVKGALRMNGGGEQAGEDQIPTLTVDQARANPDIKVFRGTNGRLYRR